MSTDELKLKTIAVLGGSYGGNRAAQVLITGLPSGWRVVLVDRNSHFNHVYNLPRYTVLPGHEHKAFIPYDNLFNNSSDPISSHPHKRVHGTITSLHPHHVTYIPHADLSPATPTSLGSPPVEPTPTKEKALHFDYAIYALGSHLPSPIELWGSRDTEFSSSEQELACSNLGSAPQCKNHIRPYMGMKQDSVSRLRSRQRRIEAARQVLVVGGGALGIQFASDIAAVYPRKSITLLHSRSRLLPRFDEALGDEVYQGLRELGVRVIFGERLDMSSLNRDGTNAFGNQETMPVKTVKGREIKADLVLLCTGQKPNTSLLHTMDSRTINPKSGMVRVSRTMQILELGEEDNTFDESKLDGFAHSTAETSPTLCGTVPPSPVDTLVELDSVPPASMLPIASTHEKVVESEADAPYDPHTCVYPHLFAIGDAVDAFGACKAGHTAYYQGEVAARNVIKLIRGKAGTLELLFRGLTFTPGEEEMEGGSPGAKGDSERDLELEEYVPSLPMIKVSLGLTKSVYEVAGVVGTKDDGTDDLEAATVWRAYGYKDIDDEGMWM